MVIPEKADSIFTATFLKRKKIANVFNKESFLYEFFQEGL